MSKLALRSSGVALLAGALLFVVSAAQARAGCNPPGQTRTEIEDFTVKDTVSGNVATATAAASPNPGTLAICDDGTGTATIEMSATTSMGDKKYIGWRIETATGGASDLIADGSTGHAEPNQGKVDSTTASDKQSTLTVGGTASVREFYVKAFCDGGASPNSANGKKDADEDYYYDINGAVIEVKVVVLKVEIKAEDGTSNPQEYVDADTEVAAPYNTLKYKAVITPSMAGTFTWSTTSTKITLVNANSQTVTLNAGANASANVDAEDLKVEFTSTGSSTTCDDTHVLTVVHCTYTAYADGFSGGFFWFIGHAWWQLGIEPADATALIFPAYIRSWANVEAGYFPETTGAPVSDGYVLKGSQSSHTASSQHPWDIPFVLLDDGLSYTRNLSISPGTYRMLIHNCTHETINAADSCNVIIPNSIDTPVGLHWHLNGL